MNAREPSEYSGGKRIPAGGVRNGPSSVGNGAEGTRPIRVCEFETGAFRLESPTEGCFRWDLGRTRSGLRSPVAKGGGAGGGRPKCNVRHECNDRHETDVGDDGERTLGGTRDRDSGTSRKGPKRRKDRDSDGDRDRDRDRNRKAPNTGRYRRRQVPMEGGTDGGNKVRVSWTGNDAGVPNQPDRARPRIGSRNDAHERALHPTPPPLRFGWNGLKMGVGVREPARLLAPGKL